MFLMAKEQIEQLIKEIMTIVSTVLSIINLIKGTQK